MTTQGWAPPPPKQERRPFYKRAWFIVAITATVALLLFAGCLAVVGSAVNEAGKAVDPADHTIGTQAATPTTDAPVRQGPAYDTPKVTDFKLTVKELSRQRFGSAGDSVEYRVQLVQLSAKTFDPDKSYELTYEIRGGEDGKERQTMLIRGDEYESYEGYASTRSGVKITAKPIEIEEI